MDASSPIPSSKAHIAGAELEPVLAPDKNDVAAFQKEMNSSALGEVGDVKSTQTSHGQFGDFAALNVDPSTLGKVQMGNINAQEAPSLGDAILSGIRKASDSYQTGLSNLRMDLNSLAKNPGTVSPKNLLNMQVNLMQLDLHVNIASKIANKLSQGVQTLFKNQ